jgi:hypothetical protein
MPLPERILTPKLPSRLSIHSHNRPLPSDPWHVLVERFAVAEWLKVPLGVLYGALLVAVKRLTINDPAFRQAVSKHWQDSTLRVDFSGFGYYRIELWTIGAVLSLLILVFCGTLLLKLFKSWIQGVVSGLTVVWGLSFFCYFSFEHLTLGQKIIGAATLGSLLSFLSGTFYVLAVSRRSKVLTLQPALAQAKTILEEHLDDLEADSPIESASQDLLNRSELVESLATTIKRLARMCDILFPSGTVWENDPRPHIGSPFPPGGIEETG